MKRETWTEKQYEAAGMKSIHLRLPIDVYRKLGRLSAKLQEGRANIVSRLILEAEQKLRLKL